MAVPSIVLPAVVPVWVWIALATPTIVSGALAIWVGLILALRGIQWHFHHRIPRSQMIRPNSRPIPLKESRPFWIDQRVPQRAGRRHLRRVK